MDCYTRKQIKEAVIAKGYKWFESGNYNLNIVGVRNTDTLGVVTNKFDDCLTVSYNVDGEEKFHCFGATTDPGSHWEKNLLNKDGVAILKPGQYRGSHKVGLHQGKYEALRQQKPVKVYRDKNKDGKLDEAERKVAAAARKKMLLQKFDKDGDGKLNSEERKAAIAATEAMKKRRGGPKPEGKGKGSKGKGPKGPKGKGPKGKKPAKK